MENGPVHIETGVEKHGVAEAMAGSVIYYDLTGIEDGLLSTVNNEVDFSRSALGLSAGEYVTEVKLIFGEVQPGFHETTGVKLEVTVLDSVENGQKFTNKVDVGGRYIDEWAYQTDGWTCVAYNRPMGDLPKTGR